MATVRAIPRNSFAIVLAALILASAILVNTFYTAQGDNHDQTFYACLYAGSLSQVGTTPGSCGRGTLIQWTSATPAVAPTFVVRTGFTIVPPDSDDYIRVDCEPGEVATGGGFDSQFDIQAVWSRPLLGAQPPTGWEALFLNSNLDDGRVAGAYVVCMSFADGAL